MGVLDNLLSNNSSAESSKYSIYLGDGSTVQKTLEVPKGNILNNVKADNNLLNGESHAPDENQDSVLLFRIPDWSYQDFIAERAAWQKGFDSPTGERGWFYFKIFFRFDTQNGLFGGLLRGENDYKEQIQNDNKDRGDCAIKYLEMNVNHYSLSHMNDRAIALTHFGKLLSYINSNAPWFFNSIGGLDKATCVDFVNPAQNRILEIGLKEDAIDMRLSTLIDLYKYACFDYINLKEVVPQNLRQFDMIVVLFHTPLRWYHTGMHSMRRGTFQYKGLSDNDVDNRMTYKMYTFKGCEFVHETLGSSVYPGEISNEEPFALGKGSLQISYKRVYQHTFNEWGQFGIGDDGVWWENNDGKNVSKRIMAIVDAKKNPYYYNPGAEIFKALVDASESKIEYAMRQVKPSIAFGNLYLDYTDPYGDYAKMKNHDLKNSEHKPLGTQSENIRSALNDEGLFRNIQSAARNIGSGIRKFTSGNFF